MKKLTFRVSLSVPDDCTVAMAREYIMDAVGTMRGSYRPPGAYDDEYDGGDPGDPRYRIDGDSVRVTRIKS